MERPIEKIKQLQEDYDKERKNLMFEYDMLQGDINRMMVTDDEAELKKKLSQANSNIVDLVFELVGYMQGCVTNSHCPYTFNLADGYEKPQECNDCETCKEEFWRDKTADLITKYAVEERGK